MLDKSISVQNYALDYLIWQLKSEVTGYYLLGGLSWSFVGISLKRCITLNSSNIPFKRRETNQEWGTIQVVMSQSYEIRFF